MIQLAGNFFKLFWLLQAFLCTLFNLSWNVSLHPKFAIDVDDESRSYFQGSKGLIQRDHFSPYLFVLCMKILGCGLSLATQNKKSSFHSKSAQVKVVYLAFAMMSCFLLEVMSHQCLLCGSVSSSSLPCQVWFLMMKNLIYILGVQIMLPLSLFFTTLTFFLAGSHFIPPLYNVNPIFLRSPQLEPWNITSRNFI